MSEAKQIDFRGVLKSRNVFNGVNDNLPIMKSNSALHLQSNIENRMRMNEF